MTKISKRSFYEAIAETMRTGECSIDPALVVEFCEKEIAALDRKSEKAKERAAEKRAAGDALTETVAAALSGEFESIADIAARIEDPEATANKIAYRLNQLFKAGQAEKGEITIPATETSKARKVVAYRAIG